MKERRPYERVNVTPDTPEWEAQRLRSIGASDVPALMGLSPYGGTPRSLYRAKKGIPAEFDPVLGFIGHRSEQIIAEWVERFAADQYPEFAHDCRDLRAEFMARSRSHPFIHASFDRVTFYPRVRSGAPGIVTWQFKTAHQYTGHHWDEGVPIDIQAQVQAEMFVAGTAFAYVVVWIGGRAFRMFRIERDPEWIESYLLPEATDFWMHHVLSNIEPEPTTKRELAEVYPSKADTPIEADDDVFEAVEQRAVLLADRKLIDAELEPLELQIALHMKDHDTLTRNGQRILTYKSQPGRVSVDRARLEADYPEVYPHVLRQGEPFKVFRAVPPKKEKNP